MAQVRYPDRNYPGFTVVADWPSAALERRMFDTYMGGYHFGHGISTGQRYHSGPLKQYGFADSLYHKIYISPKYTKEDVLAQAKALEASLQKLQQVTHTFPPCFIVRVSFQHHLSLPAFLSCMCVRLYWLMCAGSDSDRRCSAVPVQ